MNIEQAVNVVKNIIKIPTGFEPALVQEGKHDEDNIILVRFKRIGQENSWGGEHFSVTFDSENKLKGFIHLEERFDTDELLSEEESEKIAFEFLKAHAPELIDTVEVRWIRPLRKQPIASPHDDGFVLSSGKIITGMRVKLFINTNNKYGWVIVGKDGHVITFERDIIWSTIRKCRATERWLHDSWAKEHIQLAETQIV